MKRFIIPFMFVLSCWASTENYKELTDMERKEKAMELLKKALESRGYTTVIDLDGLFTDDEIEKKGIYIVKAPKKCKNN